MSIIDTVSIIDLTSKYFRKTLLFIVLNYFLSINIEEM